MISIRISLVASALILAGCSAQVMDERTAPALSTLAMLFAPDGPLTGEPNLFEFRVATPDQTIPILRRGDLPAQAEIVEITNLPASADAMVSGDLFKDGFTDANKTHTCTAPTNIALLAGETQSISMSCYAVDNGAAGEAVDVFIKVASAEITLTQVDTASLVADRDWTAPQQFAHFDRASRKITLQSTDKGTYLHIGGQLSYHAEAVGPMDVHEMIYNGLVLDMEAVSGINLLATPDSATLQVTGEPLFFESAGTIGMLIPILLENASGTVRVAGNLLEEVAMSEFTVVSYNIENLFDQVDDDRNAHYSDFRIAPNADGAYSNWGEPQKVGDEVLTFTQIKIRNVIKALKGIDANGPAIVGIQEIESKAALDQLLAAASDLGYVDAQFSEWPADVYPNAIGLGVLSKFPITSWELLAVPFPPTAPPRDEPIRPILKVVINVLGHELIVYNNHWKSKSGPESWRMESAKVIRADVDSYANPRLDYIILGDLNSDYNESVIIEPRHDDTGGMSGINDILRAQGDELTTLLIRDDVMYNLHYEHDRAERRTAWHGAYGWSALDHMIIGPGMYDRAGITYVDNSFQAAHAQLPRLDFLFREDGTTNRWNRVREGKFSRHAVGGYSDHAPMSARFEIRRVQNDGTIWINQPSKPDAADITATVE